MASAMATAAARNISPSYSIHVGPRIRPPRLLPGTKAANTNPQPGEPPPNRGDVWAQGKWRTPGSNAARDRREIQSARLEKALRHATHGMNIYAYNNIRTNQVVYSLTRIMQNNKILPQLLYHGKKTKPASLRRDMWRPYFSIHFPETTAGAEAGLVAYRRLRELSVQRQLSPPRDLVIATEEDVMKAKAKYTPQQLHDKLQAELENPRDKIKDLPIKDQMLPKKLRAKKLMDQKASSVADAAFVLGLINKGRSPAERQESITRGKERTYDNLSSRAAKRLDKIRVREAETEAMIEKRQAELKHSKGRLGLTPHTARRIALEQNGTVLMPRHGLEFGVADPQIPRGNDIDMSIESRPTLGALLSELTKPSEFNEELYKQNFIKTWKDQNSDSIEGPTVEEIENAVKQEQELATARQDEYNKQVIEAREKYDGINKPRNDASRKVQILWADLRDATWAESWSSNIFHGELEQRAALKHQMISPGQKGTIDGEGNEIPQHDKKVIVQTSTTPHIFGKNNQDGWYETPEKLQEKRDAWRSSKLSEWNEVKWDKFKDILGSIEALQQKRIELLKEEKRIEPEFQALERLSRGEAARDDPIRNLSESETSELRRSMADLQDGIAKNSEELSEWETNYPTFFGNLEVVAEWRKSQTTYMELSKLHNELSELQSLSELGKGDALRLRLDKIDDTLAAHSEHGGYDEELQNLKDENYDFQSDLVEYNIQIQQLEDSLKRLENPETSGKRLNDDHLASPIPMIGEDNPLDLESRTGEEAKAELQKYRKLLHECGKEPLQKRITIIENALQRLEQPHESSATQDLPVSLLKERIHAEKAGDTEHIDTIDAEIKAKGEDILFELLGFSAAKDSDVEVEVAEVEVSVKSSARERGVEMPPPAKKGVWSRVKGVFGR